MAKRTTLHEASPDMEYISLNGEISPNILLLPEKRSIVAKFVGGTRLRRLIYWRELLFSFTRSQAETQKVQCVCYEKKRESAEIRKEALLIWRDISSLLIDMWRINFKIMIKQYARSENTASELSEDSDSRSRKYKRHWSLPRGRGFISLADGKRISLLVDGL